MSGNLTLLIVGGALLLGLPLPVQAQANYETAFTCTEEQSTTGPDGTEYRQYHCLVEQEAGNRIAIQCTHTETENPDVETHSSACVFSYSPQGGACIYEYRWYEEPDNPDRPDTAGCGPPPIV